MIYTEKDISWQTVFEIKQKERFDEPSSDKPRYSRAHFVWEIVNKHNGEVVGEYKDPRYAIKQARHKYKKLTKLMERKFMSNLD